MHGVPHTSVINWTCFRSLILLVWHLTVCQWVVAAQTKSDKHNLTGNDEKSVNGIIFILYLYYINSWIVGLSWDYF